MAGFMEGEGAEEFIEAFKDAVVPRDRKAKARDLLPPVLLLTEGERAAAHAHRTMRGLRRILSPDGAKRVPYAALDAEGIREAAGRPLTLDLGKELCVDVPRRTGGLRLTDFWLMRDIVERALDPEAPEPDGSALRDHCYAQRLERGPLLRALWTLGGETGEPGTAGPGWFAELRRLLARPLFQLLPRWWWGRRRTRRLLRSPRHGWYADWRRIRHGRTAEEFFENAARLLRAERGRDREAVTGRFEELLLHALLADLRHAARPGRISPWRRRRRTRCVLLLELPGDGAGAAAGQRFLERYGAAARDTRCAAVVVVAVGRAGGAAEEERGGLGRVAARLRGASGMPSRAPRPLRAVLPEPVPEPEGLDLDPVAPHTFRFGPVTELTLLGTLVAALLSVPGAWLVDRATDEPDRRCLGGASSEVVAGRPELSTDPPRKQYEDALRLIRKENARVDREVRAHGGTARTVVHIGSDVAADQGGQRYNAAVPELRGMALAQRALNNEAGNDSQKVWLRVDSRNAGDEFADAPRVARQVAEDAHHKGSGIIGAVGFSKSLKQTQEAVRVLGGAQIPVVGTTATADLMRVDGYYRRVAPTNSRETAIEADFARRGNIIDDGTGACSPARAAVVVKDPRDLYSDELGTLFAERFGARPYTLEYTPGGRAGGLAQEPGDDRVVRKDSIGDLADAVCEHITDNPRTVVYWASRALQFSAFLDDFGDNTACEGRRLTVLGGNDLTTAALAGEYADLPWLRLYHTVHVLPAGHPRLSDVAKKFNADYARRFGPHDLWRDDGRAALAHDAMQLMAEAANRAYRSTGDVERSNVQIGLDNGIRKQGAGGYLDIGRHRSVPRDKPVVILHHTDQGSEPVLYCGAFTQNPAGRITRWGPHGEFSCPRDS
ncbi:hypothetical protein HUT19_26690 [Streptomyces sp. NA02950]|uniref:hypothetical protein n=1 Tax=Streptomyces sp. NA02950 TaxID=2742137 RepID=UPI001591252D|nr:hypothetical protein [Streptomyces sp. NA02950]QKV94892.1 hypothetical protein HUT19_26690 [Streptomyces sp. NA02950]